MPVLIDMRIAMGTVISYHNLPFISYQNFKLDAETDNLFPPAFMEMALPNTVSKQDRVFDEPHLVYRFEPVRVYENIFYF